MTPQNLSKRHDLRALALRIHNLDIDIRPGLPNAVFTGPTFVEKCGNPLRFFQFSIGTCQHEFAVYQFAEDVIHGLIVKGGLEVHQSLRSPEAQLAVRSQHCSHEPRYGPLFRTQRFNRVEICSFSGRVVSKANPDQG